MTQQSFQDCWRNFQFVEAAIFSQNVVAEELEGTSISAPSKVKYLEIPIVNILEKCKSMKVMKDIPDLQFGEDFIWEYEDMLRGHAAVDLLQKLPCPDGVGHRPQCRGLLRLSCRLYLIFQSEYSDEA